MKTPFTPKPKFYTQGVFGFVEIMAEEVKHLPAGFKVYRGSDQEVIDWLLAQDIENAEKAASEAAKNAASVKFQYLGFTAEEIAVFFR